MAGGGYSATRLLKNKHLNGKCGSIARQNHYDCFAVTHSLTTLSPTLFDFDFFIYSPISNLRFPKKIKSEALHLAGTRRMT
ncbi:hypothetical protein IEQ34_004232 [Dendrobium chrysotoxum]|uniref:Uncharacterized protein n=1 Tax=Dendrobium chrysotoxum TaxID=161865 RepID=A0AAV7GZP5_DENCH|nr:hypothetical protein IEQ34_004232 [Dendrobium chrysotoxum]